MANGKVKWFNVQKGYGFIEPEGGGADIFVHVSALQDAGIEKLIDGQDITFELIDGPDGRKLAGELVLGAAPSEG